MVANSFAAFDVLTLKRYYFTVATQLKRATVYIRPEIHQAIKLKSVTTNQSISDIVNDALVAVLSEDEEDLRSFEEHANDPLMTYEELLARLKADGKI
jgi:hypothetical protein